MLWSSDVFAGVAVRVFLGRVGGAGRQSSWVKDDYSRQAPVKPVETRAQQQRARC